MFKVTMIDGKTLKIDADGFKTIDNGQLILYVTDENDRNTTVFVAAHGMWQYFESA